MNGTASDTIAALCTGPGGALNIIRISGADACAAAEQVWQGKRALRDLPARMMNLGLIRLNEDSAGEPCLAVRMPGPHSYTGEDVVELQCHGGNCGPGRILDALFRAGARSAEPGEFTRRAFLNGKMDLTQAEAVADLIAAQSEAAGRLAEEQLSGRLGDRMRACRGPLIDLLSELESRLDFAEEDLDWKPKEALLETLRTVTEKTESLLDTANRGALLRNGIRIVIAGPPNAGKSSLLNTILGYDRAIVTEIAGTTRDTLEETAVIRGIAVHLSDTAGLRESSTDPVEGLGIERSRNSLSRAEMVLWLLDASDPESYEAQWAAMERDVPKQARLIPVWNKTDLLKAGTGLPGVERGAVRISVRNGTGLDELYDRIEKLAWGGGERNQSPIAVSARHAELLKAATADLHGAAQEIELESWELAASLLHSAVYELGSITGETTSPDILDEIFSRFCIGK